MKKDTIALEYAKGLFLLARDTQKNGIVLRQLERIVSIFKKQSDLTAVLKHPSISKKNKMAIVGEIIKGFEDADLIETFCRLLIKRNRFEYIKQILVAYKEFNDIYEGYENISIESAVALSSQQLDKFKEILRKITNKKIRIDPKVNASLVAGLKIAYKDNIFDASIEGYLKMLKKNLIIT
jgi:F-type H+-transporting ATPase subunit delta